MDDELLLRLAVLQNSILGLQLAVLNPVGPPVPQPVRDKTEACVKAMLGVAELMNTDGVLATSKDQQERAA